jgi:ribosomal protein L11
VIGYWRNLLGERLIVLEDYHAISATIATLVAVQHGVDMASVVKSFDNKTANTVSTALAKVNVTITNTPDEGIIKL